MRSRRRMIVYLYLTLGITAALTIPLLGSKLEAQQATITKLAIEKKPGAPDGKAMATVRATSAVKGKRTTTEKTGRIATHALQAWTIMDGKGALLLLSPEKKGRQYRLRYYQLDSGKGRLLGRVPFAQASMEESKTSDTPWAFAVSGIDPSTNRPATFVGDIQAIHAQLDNAANVHFSENALVFHASGESQTLKTAILLGQEATGRIYAASGSGPQKIYLQFLSDGESITTTASGEVEHGRWITDGSGFSVTSAKGQVTRWPLAELSTVTGVPAESRLTVRLLQPLSSRTAKKGTEVRAVLISPGIFQGDILIPQGSEFDGTIVEVHEVGWGIRHETAALTVHFRSIKFPDERTLPIDARVFKVENSRESVTDKGKIQGIRSTGTLGHSAENQIASLAQIDPIAYIFTGSSGPAVLGFAEPEILYNAGTELDIEFNKPVITAKTYTPRVPHMNLSGEEATQFNAMVKSLPFRTRTETTHKPSDITNLIFIGKPEALRRAFLAAGWTSSDALTAAATFQTVKTLAGNQTYTQAPMSTLILGDDQPLFTMQKTTNTFSSRHHLRVFQTGETFDGEPVLTASSTQDIGIAFSYKQKTFIHVIDQYLDNERSKVTNDLEFTGCVDSIDLVPRPWVPRDAYNSTGDRLITDGDASALRLNDCANPRATPTTVATRAPFLERSERNTMLTIKDTLYRGNLIYTGIAGGIKLHEFLATQGELGEETGNWQKSDASGTEYRVAGTEPPLLRRRTWESMSTAAPSGLDQEARARVEAHKWDPPHYEIALNLGYSNYRNHILETTLLDISSSDSNKPEYFLGLGDGVFDGWAAGISLTLNTWNWVSNEFSYTRQQTKFILVADTISSDPEKEPELDVATVGLVTRRFAYNTVFNLRPRKSRWRPLHHSRPCLPAHRFVRRTVEKTRGVFQAGPIQYRPHSSSLRFWQHTSSRWRRYLPVRRAIRRWVQVSGDPAFYDASRFRRNLEPEPEDHSGQLPWFSPRGPG